MSGQLADNCILDNDIDASATYGWNANAGFVPVGTGGSPFTGSFDGQGYKICDLFINRPGDDAVGLFGAVAPLGVIKDVAVVNATVTGNLFVGVLAGGGADSTVSNCYSTGNVTGGQGVGGLLGWNAGNVSDSYFTGSVTGDQGVGGLVGANTGNVSNSYSTGNVTGNVGVGGLVGGNGLYGSGTVNNSYSTGSVTGNEYVGGLVGKNYWSTVSNSYSTGSVSGNSSVGGLVGGNVYNSTVSNSFWDTQTSGQATSDGGIGKNTTQMQAITTFSGTTWNITTVGGIGERNITYIWNIVNNVTYPFLSWQAI